MLINVCIPQRPDVRILGNMMDNIKPKTIHYIVYLALMSVKRKILMNWKIRKLDCYNIDNWLAEFLDLISMESTTSALGNYNKCLSFIVSKLTGYCYVFYITLSSFYMLFISLFFVLAFILLDWIWTNGTTHGAFVRKSLNDMMNWSYVDIFEHVNEL